MLEYVRQRQRNLLSGLSGNGESNDTTAMPKNVMMSADGLAVQGTTDSVIPASLLDTVGKLRAEFMTELDSNGSLDNMNARQQLESNLPVEDVPDQRLKVDAEVRFDTGHSTGDNGNGTRSRIRARVYPDYNIDNNWHAIGMVEWEKTLNGNAYSDDGKLKLDRYYLSGNIGEVHTDVGAFGCVMAEGNIYDSKFIGVRLQTGKPVKYAWSMEKLRSMIWINPMILLPPMKMLFMVWAEGTIISRTKLATAVIFIWAISIIILVYLMQVLCCCTERTPGKAARPAMYSL